jgi:hypothetical protein
MTGAISSCLRVGASPSGSYSIVLNEIVMSKGQAASAKGLPVPLGSAAGPKVKLNISPTSGKPGTRVSVTGILSAPLAKELAHANLCWDGCRKGLQYSGVALKWINPTTFETSLVIPGAPWVSADPVKISPLVTGNYPISIECLGVIKGCGLGSSEGTTTFHLSVPSGYTSWCRTSADCAYLTATPKTSLPGDVIKVTGYAPLLSVIGSDHPYVYQLKVNQGSPKGPQVVIKKKSSAKGSITYVDFGHAGLQLKHRQPLPVWEN